MSASRTSGEDRDAGLIEVELLRPCWAIHLRAGDPDVYSRWPLRPELVDPCVALGIWRNTKTHVGDSTSFQCQGRVHHRVQRGVLEPIKQRICSKGCAPVTCFHSSVVLVYTAAPTTCLSNTMLRGTAAVGVAGRRGLRAGPVASARQCMFLAFRARSAASRPARCSQ